LAINQSNTKNESKVFKEKTLFLSGEMELKNVANHTWCKRRSLLPALKEEQGNGSAWLLLLELINHLLHQPHQLLH